MNIKQQDDGFSIIELAIKRQQVIQIKHHDAWRTVEPYQLGVHSSTRKVILYGYCRDVIPSDMRQSRWQVFNIDDIKSIELTNYSFQTHIEYKGQYSFIQTVFSKLKPQWERTKAGYFPVRMSGYANKKNRYSR